jgi:hypothetical protein
VEAVVDLLVEREPLVVVSHQFQFGDILVMLVVLVLHLVLVAEVDYWELDQQQVEALVVLEEMVAEVAVVLEVVQDQPSLAPVVEMDLLL